MTILRAQTRIPYFTNLPEDVVTNTFHFYSDDVTPYEDACSYLSGRIQTFYEVCYGGTYGAPWVSWDDVVVNWYNMSLPAPRPPFIVPIPIAGVTVADNVCPPEVSVVLSFQGVPLSGTPQARRRGRIYLGALGTSWVFHGDDETFPVPNPTGVGGMIGAVEANLLDTEDEGLQWVIYSPTDNTTVPVANGWVDNALDTQRRRGQAATARTTWP